MSVSSSQAQPLKPSQTEAKKAYDASDRDQVKGRERDSHARDKRLEAGLKHLLGNPDARLWLWDLLAFTGIARTSFTGNSETFYREGQRNVGLRIQAQLVKTSPDAYITMMKENQDG